MKFVCPACGKIQTRDARTNAFKTFMTKRGYKSYCDTKGRFVFMKKLLSAKTDVT